MVAFMKRFAPANLVAKEVMANPAFGPLNTITLIHGSGPYDDLLKMMLFNGIHMIDLAFFFGGEIASVSARACQASGRAEALVVTFSYTSGAVGTLNMNSGHHWKDCYEAVYLSGTGTAISIDASKSCEVMASDHQFAEVKDQELFGWSSRYYVSGNMAGWWAGSHYTRGYWGELAHFAKACVAQAEPGPTLEDARKALRFIECSLTSAERDGAPIRLID
jgi:predicted dehydrogenase